MLRLNSRTDFQTLHDALTLSDTDASHPAIIYVESGCAPIIVTRADFRREVERCSAALRGLGVQPRDLILCRGRGTDDISRFCPVFRSCVPLNSRCAACWDGPLIRSTTIRTSLNARSRTALRCPWFVGQSILRDRCSRCASPEGYRARSMIWCEGVRSAVRWRPFSFSA